MENINDLSDLDRQLSMVEDIPSDEVMSSLFATDTVAQPVQQVVAQPVQQVVAQQTQVPVQSVPVQNVQNVVAQPVQQAVQHVPAPVIPAQVEASSEDLSIFDEDSTIEVVDIGTDIQEDTLPFINLKGGERTRITLFTKKQVPVYTHYHKDLGYHRCLSKRQPNGWLDNAYPKAPCCKFMREDGQEQWAALKRIIPVIEYPMSKDAKTLLANGKPALKFISLGKPEYDALSKIIEENGEAALTADYIYSCGEDRYKKKEFTLTMNSLRSQFVNEIKDEISKFTTEMLVQASEEKFRKIPAARIQQVLNKELAASAFEESFIQQQANAPVIDL